MSPRQWLLTIVGMIAVIPASQFIGRKLAEAQNLAVGSQQTTSEPASADVDVSVTRQASNGVIEAKFDQTFLINLEAWALERAAANSKKYWDASGVPMDRRKLTGKSVIVERGGHRLAVVRIGIGDEMLNAMIVGIVENELVRVNCLQRGKGSVPITSGPCDAKLREVFGDYSDPLAGAAG